MKAIYLGFDFLKKKFELIIAAPTRAAVANIEGTIIYSSLSIDGYLKNKKQRIVKSLW